MLQLCEKIQVFIGKIWKLILPKCTSDVKSKELVKAILQQSSNLDIAIVDARKSYNHEKQMDEQMIDKLTDLNFRITPDCPTTFDPWPSHDVSNVLPALKKCLHALMKALRVVLRSERQTGRSFLNVTRQARNHLADIDLQMTSLMEEWKIAMPTPGKYDPDKINKETDEFMKIQHITSLAKKVVRNFALMAQGIFCAKYGMEEFRYLEHHYPW